MIYEINWYSYTHYTLYIFLLSRRNSLVCAKKWEHASGVTGRTGKRTWVSDLSENATERRVYLKKWSLNLLSSKIQTYKIPPTKKRRIVLRMNMFDRAHLKKVRHMSVCVCLFCKYASCILSIDLANNIIGIGPEQQRGRARQKR